MYLSHHSCRSYPNAYIKNMSKWWDHFEPTNPDHKVVIMDDVHPSWKELVFLKQWADRYTCCHTNTYVYRVH